MARVALSFQKSNGLRFCAAFLAAGLLAVAQTAPVVSGYQGATSAAFWYLGGVTPNCCAEITDKYWTVWQVYLTTNTSDPNPVVDWYTDSPGKVLITQTSSSGALLQSVGYSQYGGVPDIHVWATVDGVSSNQFPVYINAPWTQTGGAPSPYGSCATTISASYPNGWVGHVVVSITDLLGNPLVPIDARETSENESGIYPGEDWTSAPITEATWPAADWSGDSFNDTFAMCWSGSAIPETTSWGTGGTAAIYTSTQKYWVGTYNRFQGFCTQRAGLVWYTNSIDYIENSVTSPVANQQICAQGQYAN